MLAERSVVSWIGAALFALLTVAAPLSVACLDRELAPLQPCVVSGVANEVQPRNIRKVDLLFVVDDSRSMQQEQDELAKEFRRLAGVLASGDRQYDPESGTGDGEQDFPPVQSLRVGVVSTEMPTDSSFRSCNDAPDDGVLIRESRSGDPACSDAGTGPQPWLQFDAPERGAPDPGAVDEFAGRFSCLARLGTTGCGYEQPLEAALKALTPRNAPVIDESSSDPTAIEPFTVGVGHGDTDNDGFVRPDSLLSIVLVTDEDDCSSRDLALFAKDGDEYGSHQNLRCSSHPEALFPVDRYVNGLLALRDNPQLLVYAAIAGVPERLVRDPASIDHEAILDHPRMQKRENAAGDALISSCTVPAADPSADEPRTEAYPPRRITRVAQRLEDENSNGIVQSICQRDFTPALDAIIGKIADNLRGLCLPRELHPDARGMVECNVVEVLPRTDAEYTGCEQLATFGRDPDPIRMEDGREVCRVRQIPRCTDDRGEGCVAPGHIPEVQGWYYDDFSAGVTRSCGRRSQRIAFTAGAEPKTGVRLRLECLQTVEGSNREVTVGTPCSRDSDCEGSRRFDGLVCVQPGNTCQLPCHSDTDCLDHNLGGYVCDTEQDAGPWRHDGAAASICVNPTCGLVTDG